MKLRKIAAVLIAIVVLCAAPIGGLVGVDGMSFFAPQAEAAGKTYKVGDIVEFGSYPQSEVTDSSLVSVLDGVSKNWVSYGYYSGTGCYATGYGTGYATMVQGDWMKYADFTYNGTKYRAVTFSQYRPYSTCVTSSPDNSYQYNNGYTPNNVYYFKYEPLKWRVLDPSTGLVLCESIIDSQAYSNTIYEDNVNIRYCNDAGHTRYANDYATSSIRTWLNNDFYNTAFSSSQKACILTSELDNKAKTSYSKYDSETTYDKVFLLSWSEMQNTAYGFPANWDSSYARQAKGTDYAKCQGLDVDSSSEYSDQCLRSATGYNSDEACYVNIHGDLSYCWYVYITGLGVRPALKISNLSSSIPKSGGSGSSSGNSTKNTTTKPAGGNNVVTDASQGVTESETFAQINAEVEREASSAEIKSYGDFKYIVVKANAYICGYSGSSKKVKIPSEIDGMPVVGITDNAFAKTSAQEITVPSSVSEFGKNAFGEEDGETRTIVATGGSPAEAYALSTGMNLKKYSAKSSNGIDDSTKFKIIAVCAVIAVIGAAAVIALIVVKKCK